MYTPAILTPMTASQGAAQAAKQTDASAPDVPFNQVLSREIAGREKSSEIKEASPKEAGNTAAPSQAAAKATTKSGDKEKTKDSAESDQTSDAAATASATPAEMLALVANFGPIAGTRVDPAAADGVALATDATLLAGGKGDATARVDAKDLAADTKAGAVKPGNDFAALMKPTIDPSNAAAAQAAQAELASASLAAGDAGAAKLEDMQATPTAVALGPLQQAALTGAQAMAGNATEKLTPHVGSPAWDQALGQKVVWMVAGEQQSASLTLNPPDLGPLQVVLNVSNAQATASFIAAQPEVRQALEAAMPKLREMLSDAGIQLGQATVSAGTPNQHGSSGESSHKASRSFDGGPDSADTSIVVPRGRVISSGQGLVDTFA
jgi:flagellar hook-length control protein FliK